MNNVTINGLSALGLSAVLVNGDVTARNTLTLPSVYAGVNLSTTLSGSMLATVAAPTISGSIVSTVNGGTVSSRSLQLRQQISIASTKSDCPIGRLPQRERRLRRLHRLDPLLLHDQSRASRRPSPLVTTCSATST